MIGTILERFESKFAKSDGCWRWIAYKNNDGYGKFMIDGRSQSAHRVAYQLYVGGIPPGMCVCHRCDNPCCVNPAHLFLGTISDNMRDCDNKGRRIGKGGGVSGEKHWNAKLTEAQIIKIRAKYGEGARGVDLAKEFGVSQATISMIVCGHAWTKI